MRNPTPLSMLGSTLIANDVNIGWVVLILANMLWIHKHIKSNNKEAMQLHGFYVINSIFAVIKVLN